MNRGSRLLKVFIYNALFLVTIYLAYRSIDWTTVASANLEVSLPYLILSLISFSIFYLFLAVGWGYAYYSLNALAGGPIWLSFLSSQVYKYLPSSIFLFSFRLLHSKEIIGTKTKIGRLTKSILLEHLSLVGTGLLVATTAAGQHVFSIGLLIIGVASLFLTKKLNFFDYKNYAYPLLMALSQISGWVLAGVSLYLFTISLGIEQNLKLTESITLQASSTAVSIMAVFSPGGLGIKELFLSEAALSPVIIVFWRLHNIFLEILSTTFALLLIKYRKRKGK